MSNNCCAECCEGLDNNVSKEFLIKSLFRYSRILCTEWKELRTPKGKIAQTR